MIINHRFTRAVLMAILFGSVYMYPPYGIYAACRNRYDFCFFSVFFNCIVQMQTVPIHFEDRVMFYRERAAKLYHPLLYWVATWLVQLAFIVGHTAVFSIIAYFMAALEPSGGRFFLYFIVLYFVASTAYFLCQSIAAISPNPQTAMSIFPAALFTNLLFTGFFQFMPNMNPYLNSWLPCLAFSRWAYQTLVLGEFQQNPGFTHVDQVNYIESFGFETPTKSVCFGILVLFAFFYTAVTCFILARYNFEKR